jgi:hypothetical protein
VRQLLDDPANLSPALGLVALLDARGDRRSPAVLELAGGCCQVPRLPPIVVGQTYKSVEVLLAHGRRWIAFLSAGPTDRPVPTVPPTVAAQITLYLGWELVRNVDRRVRHVYRFRGERWNERTVLASFDHDFVLSTNFASEFKAAFDVVRAAAIAWVCGRPPPAPRHPSSVGHPPELPVRFERPVPAPDQRLQGRTTGSASNILPSPATSPETERRQHLADVVSTRSGRPGTIDR